MNVIRKAMPEQVEALRGPLFAAYKAVARYQMERTPESESKMRVAIGVTVPMLRPFQKLLPRHKRRYLVALEAGSKDRGLVPARDLALLFDEAIYEMHIRLSPRERGAARPVEPWSDALLALLDERSAYAGPL
jgi:hypothetical protein